MNIHAIVLSKWLIILNTNPKSTSKCFSLANKFYSASLRTWLDFTSIPHL